MQEATALAVVAEGTDYVITASGKLVGGTFSTPAFFRVESVGAQSATVGAGGSGYTDGAQVLTVVGGTSTVVAQFNVTVVANAVSSVDSVAVSGDYTELPANPVATTGGGGTGATLNVTFGATKSLSLVDGGSYDVIPSAPVSTSGAGGSGLTVRPVFMPITTGEFRGGGDISNKGREKTTPERSTIREGFSGTRFTGGTGPRAISGGADT